MLITKSPKYLQILNVNNLKYPSLTHLHQLQITFNLIHLSSDKIIWNFIDTAHVTVHEREP